MGPDTANNDESFFTFIIIILKFMFASDVRADVARKSPLDLLVKEVVSQSVILSHVQKHSLESKQRPRNNIHVLN